MRFASVILVSLLLHLAVIEAVTVFVKREYHPDHTVSAMSVEYVTEQKKTGKYQVTAPPQGELQQELLQTLTHGAKTVPAPLPAEIPSAVSPAAPTAPVVTNAPKSVSTGSSVTSGLRSGGGAGVSRIGTDSETSSGKKTASVAGVPPGSSAASSAESTSLSRRAAYQALLKRLIEAHKEYPLAARKSRREGSCQRRFIIDRTGSLRHVETISSCGHAFLDEAATRAIASVGTFPPLPDAFGGAEESFTITMTFTLARD